MGWPRGDGWRFPVARRQNPFYVSRKTPAPAGSPLAGKCSLAVSSKNRLPRKTRPHTHGHQIGATGMLGVARESLCVRMCASVWTRDDDQSLLLLGILQYCTASTHAAPSKCVFGLRFPIRPARSSPPPPIRRSPFFEMLLLVLVLLLLCVASFFLPLFYV